MISPLFLRQLERLDSTLYIKMDWRKVRFVVYRKDRQNVPRQILVIENETGDFCYPNYNHIARLYKMDSWQNKSIIRDIDEHNDRLTDESDEKMRRINREMSLLATRSRYF